jgi:shikimate kinase
MNPAPNLVLIGPMGAGKTSIGKRVAAHFGLDFVDADHRLEELTGASVPVIFECEGEAGFREREADLLARLMAGRNQLVATGGGAVLRADNRQRLHERGFVVHLHASVPRQLERLARDRQRPLLQTPDREARLQALAAQRDPLYAEIADLRFESDHLGVPQAAGQLIAQLEQRWRRDEGMRCAS